MERTHVIYESSIMSLETGTTIQNLVSSNPVQTDPIGQGDDHLRLIKAVLKAAFPGAAGQGFAIPLTATEAQLNFVTGVTSNIQTQINTNKTNISTNATNIATHSTQIATHTTQITALTTRVTALEAVPVEIPSGSQTMFLQAAAPVGWTRNTTYDGRAVMLGAFSSGGTHNPLTMNLVPSHTHVDTFAATATNAGAHLHTVDYTCINAGGPVQAGSGATAIGGIFTRNSSSNGDHNHAITITGAVGANSGAANWQPLYVNAIRCAKN
jgi:hypothetical protein